MKKIIRYIAVFSAICLLGLLLVACADSQVEFGNQTEFGQYRTHTVTINNKELFDYYFTFSETHKSSFTETYHNAYYGKYYGKMSSTSTIVVTPKLTGFVDYSGYVEFKATYSGSNTKSNDVLKKRYMDIDTQGKATDVYTLDSTGTVTSDDTTILFGGVDFKFYRANITVTYHHEGLSGNKLYSYKTIDITNYNYASYLSVSIDNKYDSSTKLYSQSFTIRPSSGITGLIEFNHVELTFDNGKTFALDALGRATYQTYDSASAIPIPKLVSVKGCIDFYPPATYTY